jgi:histone deacetylase 11
VVAARCPQAVLCLDPFHVVAWATDALDEIRREVWNQARRDGRLTHATSLQRTRWALEERRRPHPAAAHPFDSDKYGRIARALRANCGVAEADFADPGEATAETLSLVHPNSHLRQLTEPSYVATAVELSFVARVPGRLVDSELLRPMRRATAGTVRSVRLALEHGIAINLGGGYHHAHPALAHGFCVYADVPIALKLAFQQNLLGRALIVDLDAHHGDGNAAALAGDERVRILDFYGDGLFPGHVLPIWRAVGFPSGTTGTLFLETLRRALPAALAAIVPDLVVYVAGVDSHEADPLTAGHYRLSSDDILARDRFVFEQVRGAGVPIMVVLAGGYGPDAWRLQYETIDWVLHRFRQPA